MLTQATWSNADDYRTATRQGQVPHHFFQYPSPFHNILNMTQAMSGMTLFAKCARQLNRPPPQVCIFKSLKAAVAKFMALCGAIILENAATAARCAELHRKAAQGDVAAAWPCLTTNPRKSHHEQHRKRRQLPEGWGPVQLPAPRGKPLTLPPVPLRHPRRAGGPLSGIPPYVFAHYTAPRPPPTP